jgi:DNA-binding transcriptional ArsR family regulator
MKLATDTDTTAEAVAVLKALSDPNRLRIFAQLMSGDTCNCELVKQLGIPANLLSHHLKALSEAGLVNARRDRIDSRWIYYSVNREAAAHWRAWFFDFLDPTHIRQRALCGPEGQGLCG